MLHVYYPELDLVGHGFVLRSFISGLFELSLSACKHDLQACPIIIKVSNKLETGGHVISDP